MKRLKFLLQKTTIKTALIVLIIGVISSIFLLWQKDSISKQLIQQQSLYDSFKKTYEDYANIYNKTKQLLPEKEEKITKTKLTQDTIIDFITYIENKADELGIPLELKSEGGESVLAEQKKISYNLSLQAELTKILDFIKLLEQEMPYLSSIESFSFTNPEKDRKTNNVQIKAEIYLK